MRDETKANLTHGSTWMRLIHMIVLVIGAVVVFQFLSKLLTGEANEHMKVFGAQIGLYICCIVRFLTFETEDKPFPFASWAAMPTGSGDKTAPAKTKRPRRPTPTKQSEPSPGPDDDSTDTPAA